MKRREFIALSMGPRRGVCLADEVIDRGCDVESELALFGLGAMRDWIPQCTPKRDFDKNAQDGPSDGREHHSGLCKGREIEPGPPDGVGRRGLVTPWIAAMRRRCPGNLMTTP
jgi:hypothetical protein